MMSKTAKSPVPPVVFAIVGAAWVAAGLWASLAFEAWTGAALFGAAGLALWRFETTRSPGSPVQIALDAFAFGIFAIARNDAIGFWQLPGPWKDVPLFNLAGAEIAYAVYLCGALGAMLIARRSLRAIEALSLIATPFLFNLLMTVAADWHMQELGALLTPGVPLSFQGQVFVGRAVILFVVAEAMLLAFSTMRAGRPAFDPKLHGLLIVVASLAAATPLLANFAQVAGFSPLLAIVFGAVLAALAQAGLWSIVYVFTGVALDWIGGKAPSLVSVYGHWRQGLLKGAIYGGLFVFGVFAVAAPLRIPAVVAFIQNNAVLLSPFLGALAFPLAATIVGSADGTPPFFGRLAARLPNPTHLCARRGRRARRRARPDLELARRRWLGPLSRLVRRRRARLRRRRSVIRHRPHRQRRAPGFTDLAGLCVGLGLGRSRRRRAWLVFRRAAAHSCDQ